MSYLKIKNFIKDNLLKITFVLALIIVAVVGRVLPHLWNATPLQAVLLAIGAYVGLSYAIPAMFAIMLVSNFFIGQYDLKIEIAVYGALILITLLSRYLKNNRGAFRVFATAFAGSFVFFVISNLAVYFWSGMYSHDLSGLIRCFTLALPFFKNSIVGDLFYSGTIFGVIEFALLLKEKYLKNNLAPKSIRIS